MTSEKADNKQKGTRESKKHLHTLKGFKDILPKENHYRRFIYDTFVKLAEDYGFSRIETPILEETSLFARSAGKHSDLVSKEMFSFVDTGGNNVSLRPEGTAPIVRSYIEHGMLNQTQPVKVYYWSPMFRREKPQAGRFRQFWQLGLEAIGSDSPVIDAQLIAFTYEFYKAVGLSEITLQVNNIGTPESRASYMKELTGFFRAKRKYLSEEDKKKVTKNPLRLLDSLAKTNKDLIEEAPQILDWIDEESKNHFMAVLEYLDGLEIPYILNPYLVRGLDYYTKTVFEVFAQNKENMSQSALAGGGRYDELVKILGGQPTPACGFAAGVERLILEMKEREILIEKKVVADIYLAQIGQQARIRSLKLFERLRKDGYYIAQSFSKDGLKAQLQAANKLNVKYALIIGQKEVLDGTVLLRDMESGVQEVVDFEKVSNELYKKYEKKGDN